MYFMCIRRLLAKKGVMTFYHYWIIFFITLTHKCDIWNYFVIRVEAKIKTILFFVTSIMSFTNKIDLILWKLPSPSGDIPIWKIIKTWALLIKRLEWKQYRNCASLLIVHLEKQPIPSMVECIKEDYQSIFRRWTEHLNKFYKNMSTFPRVWSSKTAS